ncbi:hypothetical protein K458DRAFT_403544 [Lentithecium fluviatile CBS 122367]|uniref:Altered inheritance of mitochondria protein 9, mitochondrial n=1 Tax=Lentithecium fluviatile CBS 122367 TaxID=1168545 RepID=A0A6G1J4J9_9PLEO|nr:hypothetical protein K458DRAFT_403544 [Lentithecium fluviatile CBS 122367]
MHLSTRSFAFACRRNYSSRNSPSTLKSRPIPRASLLDLEYNDDIFNYTRVRFVRNEKHELSQRPIHFNLPALARCGANAIGAESCVSIEKYPDGMFNKTMFLTMNNGSEVVVKVPNPNAGLLHFTTASEVATMEFVLAWSSRAQGSPIGAEYIIMEEARGVEPENVWPDGATGNKPLYVDADGINVVDERFAVGPSTGREFLDDGRATINFDRGPCKISVHNEISFLTSTRELPRGKPCRNRPSQGRLCQPTLPPPCLSNNPLRFRNLPTNSGRKLQTLNCCLKLLKDILPNGPNISSRHLWHSDLHVANIFVDPAQPTKIVSLIDWQSTGISPLYFHVRQPYIMDYDGPRMYGLERPELPSNIETLDASAKENAEMLYYQQALCALYNTLTHQQTTRLLLRSSSSERSVSSFSYWRGIFLLMVRPDRYEETMDALAQMKGQVIDILDKSQQNREEWESFAGSETTRSLLSDSPYSSCTNKHFDFISSSTLSSAFLFTEHSTVQTENSVLQPMISLQAIFESQTWPPERSLSLYTSVEKPHHSR